MSKSFVECFPFPEFREGQAELLDTLEASWEDYEVFVIRAPVGFGKSPVASAIQASRLSKGNGCCILTPNNLLRSQYLDNFDHMRTVKSQDEYIVPKYNMTEREFRKKVYKWGPRDSQYNKDYKAVRRKTTAVVGNFYTYIAHKLSRDTLIVDEAHSLLGTLQELAAKRIWQHDYNYPRSVRSFGDLIDWVDTKNPEPKLERLKASLESTSPSTLVRMARELFKGEFKSCLKLIPLSVADLPCPFWGSKVKKIVLMSATIGPQDLDKMGLSDRRVLYVDVKSPIPVERRPVIFNPIGNMSYAYQDDNLKAMVVELLAIADHHEGKGFIHAPYGLAEKLRPYLTDSRFIYHDRDNKVKKYKEFYTLPSTSRAVMVGSGMHEGLDMKYDVAEWQALIKVPYPSLADPAMRYIANNDPDYYNWQVSRDVMQASGRICRAPDDEGCTYILDSQFKTWYNRSKEGLPNWFVDSVEGM